MRYGINLDSILKSCLDDFLNKHYLSHEDYKFLKPCDSKPGIIYKLCKIHIKLIVSQEILLFRPILSAVGTSTYNLAHCSVPFLKEYTIN